MSRELIAADGRLGARNVVDRAVRAAWSAGPPTADRERCAALAELFEVAGWIAYDAERQDDAARLDDRALVLARLAGDRAMENLVKLNMSLRAAHVGRYGDAVALARSVVGGGSRVRTLCLIREARAHSKAGSEAAVGLMRGARAHFLDGPGAREPDWAWWIDDLELDGHHAGALLDLGRPGAALPLLHRVVEAMGGTDQPNYRVIWQVRLVEALLAVGDRAEAEAVLERLPAIGSARALRSLRSLLGAGAYREVVSRNPVT